MPGQVQLNLLWDRDRDPHPKQLAKPRERVTLTREDLPRAPILCAGPSVLHGRRADMPSLATAGTHRLVHRAWPRQRGGLLLRVARRRSSDVPLEGEEDVHRRGPGRTSFMDFQQRTAESAEASARNPSVLVGAHACPDVAPQTACGAGTFSARAVYPLQDKPFQEVAMRWRALAVAAVVGVIVLGTASPALAKGPDQATVTGPGLSHPIVVAGRKR